MLYSNGAGIIDPACYGGSEGPYYWKHKFNNELVTESEYRCADDLVMAAPQHHGTHQTFGKDPDVIIVELYGNRGDSSGTISYVRARLRNPDQIVWTDYIDVGTWTNNLTLLATQRAVVAQGSTAVYKGSAYFIITLRPAVGNPVNVLRIGPDQQGRLTISSALATNETLPNGCTFYYEGVIWYGFDYQRVYDMVDAALKEADAKIKLLQDEVDAINNDVQNKFVCR